VLLHAAAAVAQSITGHARDEDVIPALIQPRRELDELTWTVREAVKENDRVLHACFMAQQRRPTARVHVRAVTSLESPEPRHGSVVVGCWIRARLQPVGVKVGG
jgi:hypothetical protein